MTFVAAVLCGVVASAGPPPSSGDRGTVATATTSGDAPVEPIPPRYLRPEPEPVPRRFLHAAPELDSGAGAGGPGEGSDDRTGGPIPPGQLAPKVDEEGGLPSPSARSGPDRTELENELFGGPPVGPTETSTAVPGVEAWAAESPGAKGPAADSPGPGAPAAPRDRRLLDRLTDRLTSRLDDRDDWLDIGGRTLLQLQLSALDRGDAGDFHVRSPSFLDLYVDARPSDRVRLFAQGRIQTDFTLNDGTTADGGQLAFQGLAGAAGQSTQALLDQLWLKFDVARTVYVTAGQQRVRWGSGRVFNPTDFLNRQRLNPVAIFDQRLGLGLLRLHLPLERLGWNFYAVLDLDDANSLDRVGGLLRGEFLVGPAEVAATLATQRDLGERIGLDASVGVWLLELRTEWALTTGGTTPFFEGDFDLNALQFPTATDRSDEWLLEAMLGFDLTLKLNDDGDNLILGAEYYYNQGGYPDSELLPFFGLSAVAAGVADGLGPLVGLVPPPLLQGAQTPLNPFRYGQHYLALFATLIGPGSWDDTTVLATGISNLSDRSGLVRLDWSQQLLTFVGLRLFGQAYVGERGGIFRLAVDPLVDAGSAAGQLLANLPPLDDLATQGIAGPLFDVGVALTLTF